MEGGWRSGLRANNQHMSESAGGGCLCTDEKQFPELCFYARRCEFKLQLGMLSDRCSIRFFILLCAVVASV